jgi:hypothetical protein
VLTSLRQTKLGIVRRGMCEWEDERPMCGDALNSVQSLPERYGSESTSQAIEMRYMLYKS